ncbi:hypothetical protein C5167_005912 [Papaver somniferum]|uniref:Uncharacterized protein n=1 Tax=Papaver somniferum TaxID=3469 RepID=A0A4Y7JCS3_PAPSO|nr:hypothetical protein C5167_005912 [Papaver somniferum]
MTAPRVYAGELRVGTGRRTNKDDVELKEFYQSSACRTLTNCSRKCPSY